MRKLLMLTAVALAAMAVVGTSAASATPKMVDVSNHTTGAPCPAIVDGGTPYTSGGCLVEDFEGTFIIWGTQYVSTYSATFDLRVGPNGIGYAVNPVVNNLYQGFPRVACRDTYGQVMPWNLSFLDITGSGDFKAVIKTSIQMPGYDGACSSETDTIDVAHVGADGWTELTDLTNTGVIRYSDYSADTTVDLVTHP